MLVSGQECGCHGTDENCVTCGGSGIRISRSNGQCPFCKKQIRHLSSHLRRFHPNWRRERSSICTPSPMGSHLISKKEHAILSSSRRSSELCVETKMNERKFEFDLASVNDYKNKKRYAFEMFESAAIDYVGSRCLILNEFSPGFGLFSQSIEKLLKAIIYLETGETIKGHDPYH